MFFSDNTLFYSETSSRAEERYESWGGLLPIICVFFWVGVGGW